MKHVCVLRGARSVSDFARSALLTSIENDGPVAVDQRLADLEAVVQHIADVLEEMAVERVRERSTGDTQ